MKPEIPIRLLVDKSATARDESVLYAARFRAKKAVSSDNTIVTREGFPFWVVDSEWWVPATAAGAIYIDGVEQVPGELKLWDSLTEAQTFMKNWEGHPWYAQPKEWEIVRISRVFKFQFSHYEVLES
jgi:hypothetical protein